MIACISINVETSETTGYLQRLFTFLSNIGTRPSMTIWNSKFSCNASGIVFAVISVVVYSSSNNNRGISSKVSGFDSIFVNEITVIMAEISVVIPVVSVVFCQ